MRAVGVLCVVLLGVGTGCGGSAAPGQHAPAAPAATTSGPRLVVRGLRRDGASLFADEGVRVREAVAARLAAAGWDVVPV